MANLLASNSFPDNYYTNLVESAASVKYVSASGSDSNNGNTVGTPYLTIAQALSATSATSTAVTIVVLQGTYTLTPGVSNGGNGAMLTDSNKPRIFVCCPGKTILQYTATVTDRDAGMIDFQNAGSAIYGAILKRNNNGRTTNYMTSFFINTFYRQQGKFYNCVFSETNANNLWSIQYDNNNNAIPAVFNCTFYNAAASGTDYGGTSSWAITDTVFNTTVTTSVTLTRVTQSATVNATTYVATGITTAGVYSGTYAWNGTTTMPTGLSSSAGTFYSGVATTITLATTGLTNGSTVAYTISGVTSAEISGAPLTGNFTINNNSGSISITPLRTLLSGSISIISGGYAAMWPISYPVAFTTPVGTQPSNLLIYPALTVPATAVNRVALAATYTIDTVNIPKVINNSNRTANTSGSTALASLSGPTLDAAVNQKTVGGSTVQPAQTTVVQTREYWL